MASIAPKLSVIGMFLLTAALGCGGEGTDESSKGGIKLDKDHDGVCDSDVNTLETACTDEHRADGTCPVPEQTKEACNEICANVLKLGTSRESECFQTPSDFTWLTDMKLCVSNCVSPIIACTAVSVTCFKGAQSCADVKKCRIETMR